MWNSHISATNLIDTAVKAIGARLPPRWRLRDRGRGAAVQAPQDALPGADAVWELRDPDGLASDILVEAQANPVEPRMVGRVADRLQALSESICGQTGAPSSLLEPDAIVDKESPRGRIVRVDWEALAHRWAMDYDFASSNVPTTWLEPRGTGALFSRLRDTGIRYAVTGSFAGHRLAPIAEPRLAALYVDDPDIAARSLGLRPAETGGNVFLVRPFDPVAFERAEHDDGIAFARATQVLPDLMTGPGRGPAEAEALLAWMRDHEALWQLPLTETT
ncbi:MAG: hypothetical protein OXC13_01015 [Caldilineaceae bacterium]|nr:hypothetical protein [Caldilineaceae bacterium]